jgi:hypothetical protein
MRPSIKKMTLLLGAMVRIGAAYTQETWPKELAATSWKVGHSRTQ